MFLLREGSKNNDDLFMDLSLYNTSGNLLMLFPERNVAQDFFSNGMAEKNLINWCIENYGNKNKIFLDIGAHVGTYTLSIAPHMKKTYAFECNPLVYPVLGTNIILHKLHDRTTMFPFGLGNDNKVMTYYIRSKDGGGNGFLPLENDQYLNILDIDVKRLDDMKEFGLYGTNEIGLIKIDVEGFEIEVLKGALITLRVNNSPPILFESWGEWKNSSQINNIKKELFTFLDDIGYNIITLENCRDMYLAVKK